MLKVAITGNIASGKSQVEKIFAERFPVYDADKIAHEILGDVDRKALGAKVFSDPKARKELEEYIHPKVKEKILEIFSNTPLLPSGTSPARGADNASDIVLVSIPLLFETGFDKLFDKIIFVAADENIRLERLMKRNNFTKEEALLRMNAQLPQEDKIKKSDFVIYNNSTLEKLQESTLVLITELLRLI